MMPKTTDNGEVFSVEGSNMLLARGSISPDVWSRLSVMWKLEALFVFAGCSLEALYGDQGIDGLAPCYVECQQQDIFKIRDGMPGHGPQKVTGFFVGRVILACGCTLPVSWLASWEQSAVLEFQKRGMERRNHDSATR
jgi:hypothetical protein